MMFLISSVNCRRKPFPAAAHAQPHYMAGPLSFCLAQ